MKKYSLPPNYVVEQAADMTWDAFIPGPLPGSRFWASPAHATKAGACSAARANYRVISNEIRSLDERISDNRRKIDDTRSLLKMLETDTEKLIIKRAQYLTTSLGAA